MNDDAYQYGWFGTIPVLYDFESGVHLTSTLADTVDTLSFVKCDTDDSDIQTSFICMRLKSDVNHSRYEKAAKGVRLMLETAAPRSKNPTKGH